MIAPWKRRWSGREGSRLAAARRGPSDAHKEVHVQNKLDLRVGLGVRGIALDHAGRRGSWTAGLSRPISTSTEHLRVRFSSTSSAARAPR